MLNYTNVTNDSEQAIQIYNITAYVVLMTVGIIWNGTLLFMFVRHKEIRTTANTMIINLAVCDFVNLSIVAPLRYTFHYPHEAPDNLDLCRQISAFQHWILNAGALSLVALSIQRFCITVPHSTFHFTFVRSYTKLSTTVYIIFVWTMSLLLALPYSVIWDIYGYLCGSYNNKLGNNIMILVNLLFFCVLLPFLMFFFNLATARRLKNSVNISVGGVNNSSRELVRKRSANMVTVLSVLFLLNHLPYFLWCVYAYWTPVNRHSTTSTVLECISKHLLFLNSCFDPVTLYFTSSTFRRLFRRYFCCLKEEPDLVSIIQFTSSSNLQR